MNKETKKSINSDLWKLYVTDKSFNGVDLTYGLWLENRVLMIESEKKSLKENLQAIAGCTEDAEEPLTKCIHGIATKHLKE